MMLIYRMLRFAFAIISVISVFSCNTKDDEIINDSKEINYQKAFKFLEKNSKINFHLENGKLLQDFPKIDSTDIAKNINLAYAHAKPYIKNGIVSEQYFANYILPYKINLAVDKDWRKDALSYFKLSDTAKIINEKTLINACNAVNNSIRGKLAFSLEIPDEDNLTFKEILSNKKGSCVSFANLAAYLCRANGLPVTIDYVPSWGNMKGGHAWNVLVYDDKKFYPFQGTESNIGEFEPLYLIKNKDKSLSTYKTVPKVYRKGFIPDTTSVYIKYFKELLPLGLSFNYNAKDVTDLYTKTAKVNINGCFDKKTELLILSVFNYNIWNPIAAISPKHEQYVFDKIGGGGLYLITNLNGGSSKKNLYFYVDKQGVVKNFNPKIRSKVELKRDKSVESEQQNFLDKEGWDYEKLEKIARNKASILTEKDIYILYKWSNGSWHPEEKKNVNNGKISFIQEYEDGIYIMLKEGEKINMEKRPFIIIQGKVIFI